MGCSRRYVYVIACAQLLALLALRLSPSGTARALLAITTSNQLNFTRRFVHTFEKIKDPVDVIFVDDASSDDTVLFLRDRGYTVLHNPQPLGLTNSWNQAYEYWKKRDQYPYLLIGNNDLLIPSGAITNLGATLGTFPFAACMSTHVGVGHVPQQAIEAVYNLTGEAAIFVNDPLNYQAVQDRLARRSPPVLQEWFNGFLFGFRRPDIYRAEFAPDVLFDPKNKIVGQENELALRLKKSGIQIALATNAFIYHWKSVTVTKSFYIPELRMDGREDLSRYHAVLAKQPLRPVVAFAISDTVQSPRAEDEVAARELADALRKLMGWDTISLPRGAWYNVTGVDVLIVMTYTYNLTLMRSASPLTVAWARNWLDRWSSLPWFGRYNVILCASQHAARVIIGRFPKVRIGVLPLATNPLTVFRGVQSDELTADYALISNYGNSSGSIAHFDPRAVPFRGAMYGKGWHEANATLRDQWRGDLPYHRMPDLYASIRLLVDDSNNATAGWGAISRLLFDALASGVLAVTNSITGARDLFGSDLPTYSTPKQLGEVLNEWLSATNKQQMAKRTRRLQERVLREHTWANRASEFSQVLFRLLRCTADDSRTLCRPWIPLRPPLPDSGWDSYRVCILVRAYSKQKNQLLALLLSLLALRSVRLTLYLIDTDVSATNTSWMEPIVGFVNQQHAGHPAVILRLNMTVTPGFYGYDLTDAAISILLAEGCCHYLLATNGDNLYSSDLFPAVLPGILRQYDLIAWDFVTHHPRNGSLNQKIEVDLSRGRVDLGAMLMRADFVRHTGAKFLTEGLQTTEVFARDWWFVNSLLRGTVAPTVQLVHRVLFLHQ